MNQFFRLILFAGLITLFSSMTVKPSNEPASLPENHKKAALLVQAATRDGSGLSFRELKAIARELKGESLTLKEWLSLRMFSKKLTRMEARTAAAGNPDPGSKSQVVALILCILVGGIGIHRFYLGYTWQGVVQLLTLGGLGIWSLIDLIRIITGDLKPRDGEYGKTL